MASEIVTLNLNLGAGSSTFQDWDRIAVVAAADAPYREFALTCADSASGSVAFDMLPEAQVVIQAGMDTMLTGYTDYCEPSFEATQHKVEVRGRSTGATIVEHHASHPSREFRGQTILQIAQALNPGDVTFSTDVVLSPIDLFRLNPGEKVHAALLRLCQKQHLQLMGLADGSVRITAGGTTLGHKTILRDYGPTANLIRGSSTFDATPKKTTFHVHGQKSLGRMALSTIRVDQGAKTGKLARVREDIHFADIGMDASDATTMAQAKRDRHIGGSTLVIVTLEGWRDDDGVLWKPNTQIQVDSPKLQCIRNMLIKQVEWTQDNNGTFSQLMLCDPAALKKGLKSKTNDNYVTAKSGDSD